MSDERAKEIAGGMSALQKMAILHGRWIGSGERQIFQVPFPSEPWPEGIAQFMTIGTDKLTPFGLAVRRILEDQNNGR